MEAEITIFYKTERKAEAVARAVSPDNLKIPLDLFIKTTHRGTKVATIVKCGSSLHTFIATIDDFLGCIAVAEKTFTTVKNLNVVQVA